MNMKDKLQLLKNNCPENINLDDIENELNNYLIKRLKDKQ